MPLGILLRTWLVLSVASFPRPAVSVLIYLAKRHHENIEASPLLRGIVNETFYKAFCVGQTRDEITKNMDELRHMGVSGVILSCAREAKANMEADDQTHLEEHDLPLQEWVVSNLETISMLQKGDFLALHCTGSGQTTLAAMDRFAQYAERMEIDEAIKYVPTEMKAFRSAMHELCAAAHARGIKILIDAEESGRQAAIDYIALDLMSTYNKDAHALVLNTYQMYLKRGLDKLRGHLQHAAKHKYILGIKMVRGAYMRTEPERSVVCDTKQATDEAYDSAVKFLISNHGEMVEDGDENVTARKSRDNPWRVEVMLATHNTQSAREALRLYRKFIQARENAEANEFGLRSLTFAQLKGMADELSFELAADIEALSSEMRKTAKVAAPADEGHYPCIGVYKASVWGTFQECLLYMFRRADENRDAIARSRRTAIAIARELFRRLIHVGGTR
ncbi:proline oxidase Put1 [Metarhizium rileyi]|uniref:Proline dehydrogenase n=1 Tax=Metarhizium rileyi (strain RCEF 4871) TaxID=1649241 RepID=A0A162J7V5_METRR|nr:proline oxidase Put1 [Metarhizium rileyi RCEF 4871]